MWGPAAALAIAAIAMLGTVPAHASRTAYLISSRFVHAIDADTATPIARVPVEGFLGLALADPSGERVYALGTRISVIDAPSLTVIVSTSVDNASGGVVAALLHPSGTPLYAQGASGDLFVIDTTTLAIRARVPCADGNCGPNLLDPAGRRLYRGLIDPGRVLVVDTATNAVTATIAVADRFGPMAVHPSGAFLYAAAAGTAGERVAVIDTSTNAVVANVALPPASDGARLLPMALLANPAGSRLYVLQAPKLPPFAHPAPTTLSQVAVIDAATNAVVATVPLGDNAKFGLSVHPSGSPVYVGGAPGVMLDAASNTLAGAIPCGGVPTLDPGSTLAYSSCIFDTATNRTIATLSVGGAPAFGPAIPSSPGRLHFFAIASGTGVSTGTQGGAPGDLPVPGDYDGDGRADIAIWRAREGGEEGIWYIGGTASRREQFGSSSAGDIPVPGDYDGDGKVDLAVYRPAPRSGSTPVSVWFIERSSDGQVVTQGWGVDIFGDVPVPADYDGDGRIDIAVRRSNNATWFIVNSRDGSVTAAQLGFTTDVPVPADYDGDGRADIAVWRPSTGEWLIVPSDGPSIAALQQFGAPGDIAVPRDYDGDGRADLAVWRPSTGEWFVRNSRDGSVTQRQWGALGDVPAPADYDGDLRSDLGVYRP